MELITERGRLDVYDTFTWSLNYRSAEIVDLKGRKASYSRTIKIPYTQRNRAIFDGLNEFNVDNVGFNTKSSLRCFISHNGRLLMNGTCQVLQYDETKEEQTVELQVIASVKDLITKLKKLNLRDIDFNRWSHDYNAGTMYNNTIWSTCQLDNIFIQAQLGEGYCYPLVDYGKDDTQGTDSWYVEDLRPTLFLKEYIDTIFRFAGLTYTSNFFESQYWRSLVILNTQSKLEFNQIQKDAYATDLEMNTSFRTANDNTAWSTNVLGENSIYNQDEAYYLPFDLEINDPLNQWTIAPPQNPPITLNGAPSTGNIFVAQKTGTYKFILQIEYFDEYAINRTYDFAVAYFLSTIAIGTTIPISGSTVITERYIEIIKNGAVYENEPLLSQALGGLNYTGDYPNPGPMQWQNNGVLKQRYFEYSIDLNQGDYIAFRTLEPQKGTLSGAEDEPSVIHRWNFQSIKLSTELVDAQVGAGDVISFENYIPNVKADEFVDSIFNLFNLWVIDDPFQPDNLIIEPRSDFFDSGGYIDMSKKLDIAKTISSDFLADKLPLFYKYLFANSDDILNSEWNQLNDIGYADYDSEVDVDFTDKEQKIGTIFAPLIVQRKDGLYYPQEFTLDGFNKEPISQSLKIGFVEKVDGDWELRDEFGGSTQVPKYWRVAEFDSVTEPNYSLTYGTPNPFINLIKDAYWNLYNLFHKVTEDERTRNGSKEITAYFNLNENDIAELDLRRAWFVNGVYFRLVEISNFNPLSNGTTKVRLLQIENPNYDYTSNDVIFKNAYQLETPTRVLSTNDGKIVNTKDGYVLINGNK